MLFRGVRGADREFQGQAGGILPCRWEPQSHCIEGISGSGKPMSDLITGKTSISICPYENLCSNFEEAEAIFQPSLSGLLSYRDLGSVCLT